MSARLEVVKQMGKRTRKLVESTQIKQSAGFASRVFHRGLIENLPKAVSENWLSVLDGKGKLHLASVDPIADALKNWAVKLGATHYAHWFQPLTGTFAEKHDSFLHWGPKGTVIEKLLGKDLLQGEPDASSLPSGGLRTPHEARGYTTWNPTSYPFLWEWGEGVTLYLPALFFSWKGAALDHKVPLMRSEERLSDVVCKLLKLSRMGGDRVFPTLGPEQEYFIVDRDLCLLRPDLLLAGRTLFGAPPPKGQELEDHYCGSIKERVLSFVKELEDTALRLGIPVKTRHNEVSPAQYEVAPLFERASLAVDHNVMLMELMKQIALRHNLVCLLHEKPFQGFSGSGKHCNWSLMTDTGINLLDPKEDSLVFVVLLTAILKAVHDEAALLRASIGSSGNDDRLGGNEAPPTILSVFLGEALDQMIEGIVYGKKGTATLRSIDLGLKSMPRHLADSTDRNRTSFLAFTGNKFEFRAVGASSTCSFPITVMNAIVADSLALILDEIDHAVGDRNLTDQALFTAAFPILKKHLMGALPVVFSGDNYSHEWAKEAEKRGLPNIRKSSDAFLQLIENKNRRIFEGILSEEELHARYNVLVERYVKEINIEANLMVELFQTHILPVAQKDFRQRGMEDDPLLDEARELTREIQKLQEQSSDMGWEAKVKVFLALLMPKMGDLRKRVDQLEKTVDNALWPLPKYRELLFIL
ncbi:MAG: glutamine synthetase [Chlamydiae bacterium RIFCSPHIGHO2_12_FULL_44_59]|nr:MAG: glutamine synthetase [Chlamydiae bacterium RIFCSPHIGHO2_01_FULL_44_39]OGN60780.1 MAG: glutamine synthetase [Chlamydiae bacterium RIFCSPHIGHO2_12_FULL_44_59]OGN67040.1 MAG: glutamine synthetase [Chlamydiae bacterium RIFCSPLOWO2_01_FULL_44_52]OGN67594.1 MAG: glutamine synthetase [Chlamydiae bacterium RIFCSPLOWO2_02_FULL_45_22]OGN71222.1 MAG: glutamine synthetase [Chlamydiae bacterium RIFCSPLOWO2_12_FULL_45_20]